MSGEKPLGVTGGAPGPAGVNAGVPYTLTITGALIVSQAAKGPPSQTLVWITSDVPATRRIVAVRYDLTALFNFATPDASKTITLSMQNDNGDELLAAPIDVAHGTTTIGGGVGALPLAVGPYAPQVSVNPYKVIVSTDAADIGLVSAAVGSVDVELIFAEMADPIPINPTP